MKIAVCYRGDYYRETIHTWILCKETRDLVKTWGYGSNFFCNYKNHLQNLFDYLPTDYDVFLHTYSNGENLDKRLIERLKPKEYLIEKEKNPRISHSIIKTMELVDDQKYDFILNIRFDLWFLKSIPTFNIDFNKFNYPWKEEGWKRRRVTSDLMFALPIMYKNNFIESIKKRDHLCRKKGSVHLTYPALEERIGETNINFMVEGYYSSFNEKDEIPENGHLMINRNYDELKN